MRESRTRTVLCGGRAMKHTSLPLQSSLLRCMSRLLAVRPEGANHLWRKNPPRELSIDLVADERLDRVTGRAGAS